MVVSGLCSLRIILGQGGFHELLNIAPAFAGEIEEFDAEAGAEDHIADDRCTGDHVCDGRHFETQIEDRADRKHLMRLDKRPADAKVAQKLVGPREYSVLSDPQLGLQARTRVFSEFFVHSKTQARYMKPCAMSIEFGG